MDKNSVSIKIIAALLAITGFDAIFDLLNQGVFTRDHLGAADSYNVIISTLVALFNVSAAVSVWKVQTTGWYLTIFSCIYSIVQNGRLLTFGFPYAPPGMIVETFLRLIVTIFAVWFLLKNDVLEMFELKEINKTVTVGLAVTVSIGISVIGYVIS